MRKVIYLIVVLMLFTAIIGCDDESSDASTEPNPINIEVAYGEQVVSVNLLDFQTTAFEEKDAVVVKTIVDESGITDAPQDYEYNFVSTDGFSPVDSKGKPPVEYEYLQHGFVVLNEMRIYWDDTAVTYWNSIGIEYTGAYSVKDIKTIKLLDK